MVKNSILPNLQSIYLDQMTEVRKRLNSAQYFVDCYSRTDSEIEFDCTVLQFRKALEATAYAAISPNKDEYCAFRQRCEKSPDFTRDYNARAILKNLEEINKDHYPIPLMPAVRQSDGTLHFGRKENGFLTRKKFEKIYDRLGKFLHADNPWDTDKQRQNIAKDIGASIPDLSNLLTLHATFIRTENYSGVWVVEVPKDENINPVVIQGSADGDFTVNKKL